MKLSDYKDAFMFYLSLLKKHKLALAFVVVLLFIGEGLNVAIRYVFKYFIDDVEIYFAGTLLESDFVSRVIFFSILGIGFAIAYYVSVWIRYHVGNRVIEKIGQTAKMRVFSHLFSLDYDFFSQEKSGSLITKFTRLGRSIEGITEALFLSMISAIAQFLISFIALFSIDVWYMVIIMVALAISFAYNLFLQRRQLSKQEEANDAEESENSLVSDSFTNIPTIKSYAQESLIQKLYQKRAFKTQKTKREFEDYYRWFDSFNNGFPLFLIVVVLIMSAMFVFSNRVTLGDIVFVQATFWALVMYSRFVLYMFRTLYSSLVDLDSITRYLNRKPDVEDETGAKELQISGGAISINNIGFTYQGKEQWMSNFSLDIPAGKSVALVGKSGSGKSTLAKLLCRFYDVTSGKIIIDGQDVSQITQKSLRKSISFVAQEGLLFDDTLLANITFAKPDATKKEVMAAVKAAQLDDVLSGLKDGLETLVGERGIKLSGGERQRVSIARAILADRPIVILDEATSALDSETEVKIQRALVNLLEGKTAIIIAHRLSTIMHADKIAVLEAGSVVEEGTHKSLVMKKNGRYRNLWELQKGGYL